MGGHGQRTMIFFGIRDFSQSTIPKRPFVSGVAGSKPVSLLCLPPCSSPFLTSSFLLHPLLLLTSSFSAHSAYFNTRHLWWQMILGFKLSELRRKRCRRQAGLSRWLHCCWGHVCVGVCMFVCMCMVTCLHVDVCSEKIRGEVWEPPAGDHSPGAVETKVVTVCLTQRKGNGNFSIMLSM